MAEGNNLQLRVATTPAITDLTPLGTSTFPGKLDFGFLDLESGMLQEDFPSLKFESGLAWKIPMRHCPPTGSGLSLVVPCHEPKKKKKKRIEDKLVNGRC